MWKALLQLILRFILRELIPQLVKRYLFRLMLADTTVPGCTVPGKLCTRAGMDYVEECFASFP